ncbi:hypothetical protein CWE12_01445 [Aliidiomarina sedimenti]|uniref:Uncharacterized protein n=1 Tax=Aliidiomarina sedimenti TaxID=1933879 RepID=A0ABY0C1R2_9GAMM|nr:hypothetical protein [Aliidiomarina sedimenti]RUO31689.1 hypothetical protein CWE12_01445 [Aliidiomarina sedimenti]
MSNLDKEAVLDEFTAAYKAANGKAPDVEAANGWYSVDGGKNMRLAQLDEWTQELKSGAGNKKATPAKPAASKPAAKKATSSKAKKPAAKTKTASKKTESKKSSSSNGGLTAKELWRQRLEEQDGTARLPRGVR